MPTLPQAFAPWHEFYTLLGEASATMTALLFVALSIAAGVFSNSQRGAQRMFLSATVVQFASTLCGSLIVLAPLTHWQAAGGMILAAGAVGLVYTGMAWRDAVRDDLTKRIGWDDYVWFAVAPAVGYLLESGAGVALILQREVGCAALAVAMGMLLLIAIHNAWDITIWSVTRRPD